jgi:hypothetical protein
MEEKIFYTGSGEYCVFHTSNAGKPEAYQHYFVKSGWVFEPTNYEGNDLYSDLFPNPQEALEAAEDWEILISWENEALLV